MKSKKPNKLKLDDLKVDSFVTSLDDEQSQAVKGGDTTVFIVNTVNVAIEIVKRKTELPPCTTPECCMTCPPCNPMTHCPPCPGGKQTDCNC